ncbi:MAG: site-2 protease family protein [Saprospiraceae bacterium]|nr:site-2 protease family protein [Saprospiraceae bacterium]
MGGSLKLFTWFGIPVHLHWTFGLIFLYAFWLGFSNGLTLIDTFWLMGFFIALFSCVLLHEYGHSLTARRYGVHTQDIILTPIGGIARLERMPEKPVQEFLVAIAGPMVNVVIAIVLLALGWLIFQNERWEIFKWFLEQQLTFADAEETAQAIAEAGLETTGFLFYLPVLIATNIALVVFNLIPAFPMDGGRIFRALLAMRIGRVRATRVAAIVGQVIAVAFVGIGLYTGAFTLTLIGIFVFTTARTENNMVQLDDRLKNHSAAEIMRPLFTRLNMTDWMQTPIDMLKNGLERHFLVYDFNNNPVGVLEEEDILRALKKQDISSPVAQYMSDQIPAVGLRESMLYVYYLIRQQGFGILGVQDASGQIIGVIDEAGLTNFLRTQ